MKFFSSSRTLFLLGFGIIVATNIVVLFGIAVNKYGKLETQLVLTEREVKLSQRIHKENSGMTLRLAWRTLNRNGGSSNSSGWRSPAWFGPEKLKELKFKRDDYLVSGDNGTFYKKPLSKEVFIVLENNGEPYREAVKGAERILEKEESLYKLNSADKKLRNNMDSAEKWVEQERRTASRLFAIDAGLDAGILRQKYSDKTRFIIAKGLVKPNYDQSEKRIEMYGYIVRLSIENIHVPLKYRKKIDALKSPHYEIELAYGRRLEPWIVSVKHRVDKPD